MPSKVLLIGLDGADPELLRKWISAGALPHLEKIAMDGAFSSLRSTIPPFTYPAWSSLLTGVNPGKHGIIDFTCRIPNSYDVRFINATYRRKPTIFKTLSQAGMMVGAMGFPTMYPPESVNGWVISGFDSPVAVNADASFCYPRELFQELEENVTRYTLTGIQELRIGKNWHTRARKQMIQNIRDRTRIAVYLLQKSHYTLAGIVFSESDTVSHHFWSAHDPDSPRRTPDLETHSDAIYEIYRELDTAVGKLCEHLDPDGHVFIVSDHGFQGTGARSVSINRMLHQSGFLAFKPTKSRNSLWQHLSRSGTRLLPVRTQEWIFRNIPGGIPSRIESGARTAGIDLKNTLAFSEELNYFPSIWLHDQRFPLGHDLWAEKRVQILTEIKEKLLGVIDPETGSPVIRKIHFRESLYSGEAVSDFPDLILELNNDHGYAYPITRSNSPGPCITPLPPHEMTGRKGGSMNGSHGPDGILLAGGPHIRSDSPPDDPGIEDVFPTILHLINHPVPGDIDGRILHKMLVLEIGSAAAQIPVDSNSDISSGSPEPYSEDEEKEIQNRLEDLGYL